MASNSLFWKLGAAVVFAGLLAVPGASAQDSAFKKSAIDPQAVAALDKMGAYLRTLNSFEIKASTLDERVLDNDQKVQFAGTADYKVRRPNRFQIAVADDRKLRQFYYDGKSLTVFSPRMGFYASVPAPATIRDTLKAAYDKFGIELPLEDLFRWGTTGDHHAELKSGFVVGYAKINGIDTDQYAFREDDVDWQIWIARGAKPLPIKAVITTTDEDTQPQYSAVLSWTTDPVFSNDIFAFKAPPNAKPITIAKR